MSTIYILIATILWGCWPIAHKLALRTLSPLAVQLVLTITAAIMSIVYFFLLNKEIPKWNYNGIAWAIMVGLGTSGAMVAYSYAASLRNVSDIITVTAINPAIAFVIAVVLLGESFTLSKIIGLSLIIGGTIFLAK